MKTLIAYTDRMTILAILLLLVGLSLRYLIGKRRFNRRGIAGLEQFQTYKQALFTTTLEKAVNVFAALLIVAGILLYLIK